MSLHPVLAEKLSAALAEVPPGSLTRRDARLPEVPGKAHAVIGMRRAGKTMFLRQLLAERRAAGATDRAIYVSFDDDRLANLEVEQLGFLLEEYYRRHPEVRGRETVYWFLDEIQLVPGWERFVRRVLDSEKTAIVVSGSSARMLSREVHTSLRGRGMATVIRPFSFREFLRHRGEEPTRAPRRWTSSERSLIEKRFREYLLQGGFPEAQELPAALQIELLQGCVDTVLFRDVVERYGVTHVAAAAQVHRHTSNKRRQPERQVEAPDAREGQRHGRANHQPLVQVGNAAIRDGATEKAREQQHVHGREEQQFGCVVEGPLASAHVEHRRGDADDDANHQDQDAVADAELADPSMPSNAPSRDQ